MDNIRSFEKAEYNHTIWADIQGLNFALLPRGVISSQATCSVRHICPAKVSFCSVNTVKIHHYVAKTYPLVPIFGLKE